MAIHFFNDDIDYRLKHKTALKHWIKRCIEKENRLCGDINVILVSDEKLLAINRQFLNHDFYTDIITFDHTTNELVSGELYISIERVKENAIKMKTTIENELYRVVIHGVMHLCGYKDKTISDQKRMRIQEDMCLKILEF